LHFRFNAWGEKWSPWDDDAAVGALVAARLGLPVHDVPMVLEGGSIAVDGAGTLRTGLDPLWRRLPAMVAPGGRFVGIADAAADTPMALAGAGFGLGLAVRVRLAGRVSDVVLAARGRPPELDAPLRAWRERAIAAGVVTAEGF